MNTHNNEEDIRKKEKKIDRNHWMCRIQKFAFGIDAPTFYRGYCPFFWMTWVAIPAALIVALLNIFIVPVQRLWKSITTPVIEYQRVSHQRLIETPLQPSFKQFYYLKHCTDNCITAIELFYTDIANSMVDAQRLAVWFDQNPDWRDKYLSQAELQYREWQSQVKASRDAIDKRNHRLMKISNRMSLCGSVVFKWIMPMMILLISGVALFGIIKLVVLISSIGLANFVFATLVLSSIGAAVTLIYLIASFIGIYVEIRDSRRTAVDTKSNWFSASLIWVGKTIFNALDFIKETVQMTYKAECPLIIWGEETGKIEKREKV